MHTFSDVSTLFFHCEMYLKGMWLIFGGNHLCHLEIPPYAVKQADLQKSMWSSDSCMLCPDDSGFVDQEKLHQATLDTLVTFINRLLSNYTEICSSTTFKWNSSSETYIWNFYHNFAEADPKKLSPEFMFVSAVSVCKWRIKGGQTGSWSSDLGHLS